MTTKPLNIEAKIGILFPQCPRCSEKCGVTDIHVDEDLIDKPALLEYECGAIYEPSREYIMMAWRIQNLEAAISAIAKLVAKSQVKVSGEATQPS